MEQLGAQKDFLRFRCALPVSSQFSAPKLNWLINNVDEVRHAIQQNRCLFGTVDSWLIWVPRIHETLIKFHLDPSFTSALMLHL